MLKAAAAAVLLALVLVGGIWLGGHPGDLPEPVRDALIDEDAALPDEAADLIEDNYTRKVSGERLQNGSLRGMVDALDDRFSHYFSPRQNKIFNESLSGAFSGVGMTVVEHPRGLLVTGVYPGTPAAGAKIRPGDVISKVNGRSIAGESSTVATARIKGKPGTFVTLTVARRGSGAKPRRLRLKRERIQIPVVDGEMRRFDGRRFGIVRLASFTPSGVHGQVRKEVEGLRKRGAEGLVFDLRGNGGGLLEEAVLVASIFVPEGVIVTTRGRTSPRRVLRATGDAIPRTPLVMLVDRGTASASEIVTAALHERLRAPVVGRRTFGKGVFGQIFDLSNGGALDLTLGNYYTPKGRSLAGKGITPDVRAADDPATRPDEALERALEQLLAESRNRSR